MKPFCLRWGRIVSMAMLCAAESLIQGAPVSIAPSSTGRGLVTGAGMVETGVTVSLEAVPEVDWAFDHWDGVDASVSHTNPISITAGSAPVPSAVFVPAPRNGRMNDGTLAQWQWTFINSGYGALDSAPSGTGYTSIAAGSLGFVAARTDGTVVSWKHLGGALPSAVRYTVPTGLSSVVSVSAGTFSAIALRSDAVPAAWNAGVFFDNSQFGYSLLPSDSRRIVDAKPDGAVLDEDGTIIRWGPNYPSVAPVRTPNRSTRSIVSLLSNDGTALLADGSVVGTASLASKTATIAAYLDAHPETAAYYIQDTVSWFPSGMPGIFDIRNDGQLVISGPRAAQLSAIMSNNTDHVVDMVFNDFDAVVIRATAFGLYQGAPSTLRLQTGDPLTLRPRWVSATSFQWYRDGVALPGMTGRTLKLSSIQASDAGVYRQIASDGTKRFVGPETRVSVYPNRVAAIYLEGARVVEDQATVHGTGSVSLESTQGGPLFYTTDGTEPSASSTRYTGPIAIASNTTLRALAFSSDLTSSGQSQTLQLNVVPAYNVSWSVSGQGHVEGVGVSARVDGGTMLKLIAVPDFGWKFDHWEGGVSGTSASASLTVNSDVAAKAVFVSAKVQVIVLNSEVGFVELSPGLETAFFPEGRYRFYLEGSSFTLTALPNEGWSFVRWTGSYNGTDSPAAFVANATVTVKPVFGTPVAVGSTGGGHVVLDPDLPVYPYGTRVHVVPVPDAGKLLAAWGGTAAGTPLTDWYLTVTNPTQNITALFTAGPSRAAQTITAQPVPQQTFGAAPVTLSATASSGLPVTYTVVSGPGQLTGSTLQFTGIGTIVVRIDQAGDSQYEPASSTLAVVVSPGWTGRGLVTTIASGATLTVEAVPEVDWEFDHWEGVDASVNRTNPLSLAAGGSVSPSAVFVAAPRNGRMNDGSLYQWRWTFLTSEYGALEAAPSGTGFTGIAAGGLGYFAVRTNGTLISWKHLGGALANATTYAVPAGVSNVLSVSAGTYSAAALRLGAIPAVWKAGVFFDNSQAGYWQLPSGSRRIVDLKPDGALLDEDGTIVQWGTSYPFVVPVRLPNRSTRSIVSLLSNDGTALMADGSVSGTAAVASRYATISAYLDSHPDVAAYYIQDSAWFTPQTAGIFEIRNDGQLVVSGPRGALLSAIMTDHTDHVVDMAFGNFDGVVLRATAFGLYQGAPGTLRLQAGDPLTLRPRWVSATSFQWYRDGVALPGMTGRTLKLSSVQPGDSGVYQQIASDGVKRFVGTETRVGVYPNRAVAIYLDGTRVVEDQATVHGSGSVTLETSLGGAIFYTTDGSVPSGSSTLYSGPIAISKNTTIRAVGFSPDFVSSGPSQALELRWVPAYTVSWGNSGNGHVEGVGVSERVDGGTVLTLTAVPDPGWKFDHWVSGLSGTSATATLTVNADIRVIPAFVVIPPPTQFLVQVATEGGGTARLSAGASGGDVGSGASVSYLEGSSYTMTATASPGWSFQRWTGSYTGTDSAATFVANGAASSSAVFGTPVTVGATGGGRVVLDPNLPTYSYGARVHVVPVPDAGKQLAAWGGTAAGTPPADWYLTVTNPTPNITAFFTASPQRLTQTVTAPPVAPQKFGAPPVSLSATASSGLPVTYSLVSGPGQLSGSSVSIVGIGTIVIRIDQAGDSQYEPAGTTLSIVVSPSWTGHGLVTAREGSGSVTLSAVPEVDWAFDHWDGVDASLSRFNPLSISATGGLAVSAVFVSAPQNGRMKDGSLVQWGNVIREFGDMKPAPSEPGIAEIAAGPWSFAARRTDGTAVAWTHVGGGGVFGTQVASVPNGVSNLVAVSVGTNSAMGLRADGTVTAWQQGLFKFNNPSGYWTVPQGLKPIVQIKPDGAVLDQDGTITRWGPVYPFSPLVIIPNRSTRSVVSLLSYDGTALLADGSVVGDSSLAADYLTSIAALDAHPEAVKVLNTPIAGEGRVTFLVRENGTLDVSGVRSEWVLNPMPSGLDHVVDVAVNDTHTLVLRASAFALFKGAPSKLRLQSGDPLTLRPQWVSATSYQWYRDGVALPGMTSRTLKLASVQPSDAGSYQQVASDGTKQFVGPATRVSVYPGRVAAIYLDGSRVVEDQASVHGSATLTLESTLGGPVFYTTDGSVPTAASTPYLAPVSIAKNTTLRAVGFSADFTSNGQSQTLQITVIPAYAVNTSVEGSGSVEGVVSGARVDGGTSLTLTAVPTSGWKFDHWEGGLTGTSSSSSITVNTDVSVKAVFVLIPLPGRFVVELATAGGGVARLSPGASGGDFGSGASVTYLEGSTYTMTATPNSGWSFVRWLGSYTGTDSTVSRVATASASSTAVFGTPLTVSTAGGGRVVLDPDLAVYPYGTRVHVVPVADAGKSLAAWSGAGLGVAPTDWYLTVTNPAPNIAALFTAPQQRLAQTIVVPPVPPQPFGAAPVTLSAAASSGLPVTYTVVSGPGQMVGTALQLLGVGTVVVRIDQAGDSQYEPASVSVSILVNPAAQTIAFNPPASVTYFQSQALFLTATSSSGLPVTFSVSSGPAVLVGSILAIQGAGTIVITASVEASGGSPAASVTRTIVVNSIGKTQTIRFDALADQILGGGPLALTATASSGLAVNYTVVDGPAVVEGSTVRFTGVGLVHLAADQSGDSTFAAAPRVVQSVQVIPGLVVNLKPVGNPDGNRLSIVLDEGVTAEVEESTDLGTWIPLGNVQGHGAGQPVTFQLGGGSATSRFWRLRVRP